MTRWILSSNGGAGISTNLCAVIALVGKEPPFDLRFAWASRRAGPKSRRRARNAACRSITRAVQVGDKASNPWGERSTVESSHAAAPREFFFEVARSDGRDVRVPQIGDDCRDDL
jgi:hypothetical protein